MGKVVPGARVSREWRFSATRAFERLVSPTGFEPVLPAPEAGALSGLSYGDTAELDYRGAGTLAVSASRPTLRIPLQP